MTKDEALKLLKEGRSSEWNAYRKSHPVWITDFQGEDLSDVNFIPSNNRPVFDLSKANLCGTKLSTDSSKFARGGSSAIFKDAIIDVQTTVPFDFDLVRHGAVFLAKSDISKYKAGASPTIFISYTWANEDIVLAIDQWLQSKRIITKIDRRDFFAGPRIRDEIMRVMKDCDVILIFYSQASKDKPWPEFECELAGDLEMAAKQEGKTPPRILFLVLDDSTLPSVTEKNRIAVMAKGKRFELVCEEIYHNILQISKVSEKIDLSKWSDYVF